MRVFFNSGVADRDAWVGTTAGGTSSLMASRIEDAREEMHLVSLFRGLLESAGEREWA
jgi:hypothetical protein